MKKFITLEITKEVDGSVEEVKEIPGMMEMVERLKEKGWETKTKFLETEEQMLERKENEDKNRVPSISEVKYVRVSSLVRYWADASINGEEDDTDSPRMPLIKDIDDESRWVIDIDVNTGKIRDWTQGWTADVHYKTCDENTIYLIDHDGKPIREFDCYVPDFLSIEDAGYGDYICLKINEDGTINNFKFTQEDIDELVRDEF